MWFMRIMYVPYLLWNFFWIFRFFFSVIFFLLSGSPRFLVIFILVSTDRCGDFSVAFPTRRACGCLSRSLSMVAADAHEKLTDFSAARDGQRHSKYDRVPPFAFIDFPVKVSRAGWNPKNWKYSPWALKLKNWPIIYWHLYFGISKNYWTLVFVDLQRLL